MLTIAIAQMKIKSGRPSENTQVMLSMIEKAKQANADIIVFPEMAIPGYLLGDTWEQEKFLKDCEAQGQTIIEASQSLTVLFGNIAVDWSKHNDDGRVRKYNGFFVAQNGKLLGNDNFPYPFRIKTLHPNYREFDDSRYFTSLRKLAYEQGCKIEELLTPVHITINNQKLALGCILCEDGWNSDYSINPLAEINQNGPTDLCVNISSSPFTLGKNNKRNRVFSAHARELNTPLLYVNNVGIQNNGKTIYTFDGYSTLYDQQGKVIYSCPPFATGLYTVTLDLNHAASASPAVIPDNDVPTIYKAITYGIENFLAAAGIKKVVIGISGGIDSAVAAALFANILPPENLLLINMPSRYNSKVTRGFAEQLAASIGCLYAVVPIEEAYKLTEIQLKETMLTGIGQPFSLPITTLTLENIQARDRSARILAAFAAAFGGAFTCNANKSEMTVGYSTLYGDLSGFLAPLGDLWKYQVYALGRYLNTEIYRREVIPEGIFNIVPCAELSTNQSVDQGTGDPIIYPYHDYLFRAFVERWNRATPEDILEWYIAGTLETEIGCEAGLIAKTFPSAHDFVADLERWWKLYTGMAVAKRIQAPPVIAVSRRAFGFDHREAQNGSYFTSNYYELKAQLLGEKT